MMSVSVKSIKASLVNLNTTESKLEKKTNEETDGTKNEQA